MCTVLKKVFLSDMFNKISLIGNYYGILTSFPMACVCTLYCMCVQYVCVFSVHICCTHDAVGHEVMPVKLPATVVFLIEVFYLWYQILQLCRKRDKNLLAAP